MASEARIVDLVIKISRLPKFLFHSSKGCIGVDMAPLSTAKGTPAHNPHFDVTQRIGTRYMG